MKYSRIEDTVIQESSGGIRRRVMVNGEKIMIVLVELDEGAIVPMHSHYNEQAGYILKGRIEFRTPSGTHTLGEGTAYLLRSNEPHEVRNPGPGTAIMIEIFSPPREDLLKR